MCFQQLVAICPSLDSNIFVVASFIDVWSLWDTGSPNGSPWETSRSFSGKNYAIIPILGSKWVRGPQKTYFCWPFGDILHHPGKVLHGFLASSATC